MRSTSLVLALLTLLATACSDATAPGQGLEIRASADALHLRNRGPFPVHFAVENPEIIALVQWVGPCAGGSRCPLFLPGADSTVPFTSIPQYRTGQTVDVVWWPVIFDRAGAHVGSIHVEHVITGAPVVDDRTR